ncbi:E3 ubiquitin-protein ligase RNF180-like [Xiphias gladius]|uniref:E3 ubiquitin-protein ligase RNF180-like n=1 Tax=Xiphias gladius TaxID=8245 RepID=UPI001A994843|nr:E3 ubiquitin-protein ligase RNF180-like [Xiphias gladius]XP_040013002.1 E3 ubiquitin-protein ligase RNF180-like [Xiphias gladius]XP_040013003.1 E3 ubiquitin-protein ligase RNF180-like [Xiphias gladius]XP_040013004.1 E3 ubiquitin-protein ligase RNF180-like [Xiphias gladius]
MLRCRRCRRGIIDSSCLARVEATDESSAAVCSIWHVNVDSLPEWILTSLHQAQWTVGKLNCQNCRARLGGFNFINRSKCPCGRDATVHLNKSRVDLDHKRYVFIVQPRRTRPEKGQAGRPKNSTQNNERPEFNRTALDSLQLNCAAVMSHTSHAQDSNSLTDSENTQSFPLSPLYCISNRRRRNLEDDATFRSSCFCPSGLMNRSAVDLTRAGTDELTQSPISYPTSQQVDTDGEALVDAAALRSFVSGGRRLPLDQQLLQTAEDVESSVESTAVHEEVSDSTVFLRGRTVSDIVAEQEEEMVIQAPMASPALNSLSKTEKNHLKSLQRKQRRRQRWLLEQAESMSGSLLDSEEEDREGFTCAVCLDVYFSPYSCQPCGHVFCEPCLRRLAKNRPSNTPCPLCRTLISHTKFHKELNQTAKTFFPKVYYARKQNFQSAPCAKWPLPSCRKCLPTFWGYRRQTATARRRWHFAHGGFTIDTLDLTDMWGWLLDIGLVIVCIHSVNWILAFLFLCFLLYYYYF